MISLRFAWLCALTLVLHAAQAQPEVPPVVAVINRQFQGEIHPDSLLAAGGISLWPEGTGARVLGYDISSSTGKVFFTNHCSGAAFNARIPPLLKQVPDGYWVYVEHITALIDGDTVGLNPIGLKLDRTPKANRVGSNFCYSRLNTINRTNWKRSQPDAIGALRGISADGSYPLHSGTLWYIERGERKQLKISGPGAQDAMLKLLARLRPHSHVMLTHALYKNGSRLVKGTPLVIQVRP